jgi:hypothetical protein
LDTYMWSLGAPLYVIIDSCATLMSCTKKVMLLKPSYTPACILKKTKDDLKARRDLAMLCDRPTQVLNDNAKPPRALFCLTSKYKIEVMRWMEKIKFPDGYAVGLKKAVNLKMGKLTGLKSHDFHILMEMIIPVMFRGYMLDAMWQAIAELSYLLISTGRFVPKK